ncbi:MAG: thermonuclease family protein, partial [Candidatus Competibacterales bacterium]|nr:thermonuclease family protein [Candidatus Competibacterales bacterium]
MQRELLKLVQRLLRGELRKFRRRRSGGLMRIAIVIGLALAVFGIDYLLREPDLPAQRPGTDLICAVREVADGDTVTLSCPGGRLRVRVWGIDAPESGQQPWGDRSRDHLRQLLQPVSEVQVQIDDTDRYGRSVARLFVDQRDIGLAMV